MKSTKLKSYQKLDKGLKRKHNEDNLLVFEPKEEVYLKKGRIYIVADGIGGLNKGEVASKMATEVIKDSYYSFKSNDIEKSLIYAIGKANTEILKIGSKDDKSGTTVVCAVIKGNFAYVANVGDSRAYLFRKGKLEKITQDHSFVGERVRMGELTEEEARVHPRKNIILRCLGDKPKIEVDTFKVSLNEKDKLMLCTDGLWGEIPNPEIEKDLNKESSEAIKNLVDDAKKYGGSDNIAVILVDILEVEKEKALVPSEKKVFRLKVASYALAAAAFIFLSLSFFFVFRFFDFSKPVAEIIPSVNSGDVALEVNFDSKFESSNYKDSSRIVSYMWDVDGDGIIDYYGQKFSHNFNKPGEHEVFLECEDNYRKTGSDKVVISVIDESSPEVSISIEDIKDEYWVGDNEIINIDINASDNYGLEKVTLYKNKNIIKEFTIPDKKIIYSLNLDEIEGKDAISGPIYAVACDKSGKETESNLLEISVNKDTDNPKIASTSIDNIETLEIPYGIPYFELITVNASDNRDIDRVEFYVNDKIQYKLYQEPYKFIWEIKSGGIYSIHFEVYDKYGNDCSSITKQIEVNTYPEGYFVFAEIVDDSSEIFIGNRSKWTKARQLTNDKYDDISPCVSYREDKIYFGSNIGGDYDIYVMDINGGYIRKAKTLNSLQKVYPLSIVNDEILIYRIEGEDANKYHYINI